MNLTSDVLTAIWSVENRVTSSGQVLAPDQRIPVIEAIREATIMGACEIFEEDTEGSIERGNLADFAILSASPLAVDPLEIVDHTVEEMIMEGRTIYRRSPVQTDE